MSLKELLKTNGFVVIPGCFDPLSAKIIERCGFQAAYLGGWAVGAHLTVTEPMTNLTDMVDIARKIKVNMKLPLMMDANAAFGDLPAVERTIREIELAGVAGIH